MDRLFSGSGDKTVEVGVKENENPVAEKIRKYQVVKEGGDINEDDSAFFGKKTCDVCAKKSYEFGAIDVNDESMYSNNLNHEDLADVKWRISEYENVIDSLKLELNNERHKLNECFHETYEFQNEPCEEETTRSTLADLSYPTIFFTTNIDSKFCSDKDLKEYEKQLQSYQRTLNVAQNVKKNAIRKQMLAKAFKLKLLEVENQCNIELLRIKQNLQCLEPLKMIAESWKTEKRDIDLSKYDLSPLFPDILLNTATCETISSKESNENQNSE